MIGRAAVVWLLAWPAFAEPTLQGRLVTFNVLTYDDPANPYLQATGRTVQVGDGRVWS